MAQLNLFTLDDTARFARLLMHALSRAPEVKTLLLRGDLGSGKTTLTRFMVLALPGGQEAEVASPSFTLCNQYPTVPPVLHCDLYRCPASLPEDLLEALDAQYTNTDTGFSGICIVEWAEFLPLHERPEEYLDIALKACEEGRLLTLQACGSRSEALLRHLCEQWSGNKI